MVVGLAFDVEAGLNYFWSNFVLSFFLYVHLKFLDTKHYSSSWLTNRTLYQKKEFLWLALSLVTLAGLPPTCGFLIKLCVLEVVGPREFLVRVPLVLGSLIRLYYYGCLGLVWGLSFFGESIHDLCYEGHRSFGGVAGRINFTLRILSWLEFYYQSLY